MRTSAKVYQAVARDGQNSVAGEFVLYHDHANLAHNLEMRTFERDQARKREADAKALIKRIIATFDSKPNMAPIIYEARAFIGQPVSK